MSREQNAGIAARMLMSVFNDVDEIQPNQEPMTVTHSVVTAPSGRRYLVCKKSLERISQTARSLSTYLDYYPIEKFADKLRRIVVDEKDAGTAIQLACAELEIKILRFLNEFESQCVWAILFAVRNIDQSTASFTVGSCAFDLMTNDHFLLWGRRYSSGCYSPPPDTNVRRDWGSDERLIIGNTVAVVEVHAADCDHAVAKGRMRIEEAINVLRYGQLVTGFSHSPFPEVGASSPSVQRNHVFAMQISPPLFSTTKSSAGATGNDFQVSQQALGWNGLDKLIQSDVSVRNNLEIRISTALQWIGQAAMAPAASIRIVALVTALEAILIDDGESIGKKAKLSRRISALLGGSTDERAQVSSQVVDIYRIRSECVHTGLLDVEKEVIDRTVMLVARVFDAMLSTQPYNGMTSVKEILDHIEGTLPKSDRQKWIAENAYLRYCDEVENPGKDRSVQHWLDAERECNSQRFNTINDVE